VEAIRREKDDEIANLKKEIERLKKQPQPIQKQKT
jgi:hypothetical protein